MRASVFILLVPLGLAASYSGYVYYRIVWLHIQTRQALLHVDQQLTNHHASIPHFLVSLSHYVHNEAETFEHVIQARYRSLAATTAEERMMASAHLSHALHHLFRVSESCAEFHANDEASLIHLQVVLSEQKIALARDYYNHVSTHFNDQIQRFPHRVFAQIGGFERKQMFALPDHSSREYASLEC